MKISDAVCFLAGASSKNPDGRYGEPAHLTTPGGVVNLLTNHVTNFYEQGFRRFYIDSPFGKDTVNGHPEFTFFGDQRSDKDSPWNHGFEKKWEKVAGKKNINLLIYLGNPYADPQFQDHIAKGRFKEALRMFRTVLQKAKNGGFHQMGIDATGTTDDDHWMGELFELVEMSGLKVLIEATPHKGFEWLTRFGTIRTTWFVRHLQEQGWKNVLPVKSCLGDKIQLFNGTSSDEDWDHEPFQYWAQSWINRTWAGGERPAFAPHGINLSKLF